MAIRFINTYIVGVRNTKFYLKNGEIISLLQNQAEFTPEMTKSIACGADGYPLPSYTVKVETTTVVTADYNPYQKYGDSNTRWALFTPTQASFSTSGSVTIYCTPSQSGAAGSPISITLKVSCMLTSFPHTLRPSFL